MNACGRAPRRAFVRFRHVQLAFARIKAANCGASQRTCSYGAVRPNVAGALMPAAAQQMLLVALVLLPAVAGWEDCSSENLRNCSLPRWGVSWDMASSLYVYCFGHCPLASLANQTHLGNFSGVVGVDHYWTKQGMPCVDGEPTEFANQDAFATKWKTTFPGTRVLEYRITDAVFYDPLVYNKMQTDPDFFVRFKNGSVCQTAPKAGKTINSRFGGI